MSDAKPVMGQLLIQEGLLTESQLREALDAQHHQGGRLGYHLIRLGHVNVQRLSQFLRESMGLIPYDLTQWIADPTITEALPANIAQFYQVVPVERKGNTLTVAIADLDNPSLVPALEELTGLSIDPLVCPRETVVRALERFYGVAKDPGVIRNFSGDHLFILSSNAPRIRPLHWSTLKADSSATDWLRTALAEAIRQGCRTVTVRPGETNLKIGFKTSGIVEDRFALHARKREEMDALLRELARIKDPGRSARMEGRVRLQVGTRFLTLHVKGMATLQGSRYTLTLYDEKVFLREWKNVAEQLGEVERASLEAAFEDGPGLVLLCGAPGSGMENTYYALLQWLSQRHEQAVSLEEYALATLERVAQMEASRQEGATWPELISLALKQEPAVFGCYPVKERASMELTLLAAAHTRVLAVLHQPDALSAIRWMLRNQFRSPLKAGVLKGILSVASLPALCPHCRLPLDVRGKDGRTFSVYTRQGCEHCLAWESLPTEEILEWMPLGISARALVTEEPSPADIEKHMAERGVTAMGSRVSQRARLGQVDGREAQDLLG